MSLPAPRQKLPVSNAAPAHMPLARPLAAPSGHPTVSRKPQEDVSAGFGHDFSQLRIFADEPTADTLDQAPQVADLKIHAAPPDGVARASFFDDWRMLPPKPVFSTSDLYDQRPGGPQDRDRARQQQDDQRAAQYNGETDPRPNWWQSQPPATGPVDLGPGSGAGTPGGQQAPCTFSQDPSLPPNLQLPLCPVPGATPSGPTSPAPSGPTQSGPADTSQPGDYPTPDDSDTATA